MKKNEEMGANMSYRRGGAVGQKPTKNRIFDLNGEVMEVFSI